MPEQEVICVCGHEPHDDGNCPVENCEPHVCDIICPDCQHAFSSVVNGRCKRRIVRLGHPRWGQPCECKRVVL